MVYVVKIHALKTLISTFFTDFCPLCVQYSPSVLFHKSQKEFSIFTLFFPAWTWINGISKLFKNAVHIIDNFIIFFFVKYRHDTSKISWSRSVRKKIGIIFDPVLNFSRYLRLVNWSDFSKAYWFLPKPHNPGQSFDSNFMVFWLVGKNREEIVDSHSGNILCFDWSLKN